MRDVHGAGGRRTGAVMPRPADRARRRLHHDGRRHGAGRCSPPPATRVRGARRGAVRILHAGHSADGPGSARGDSEPDARRDSCGAGGQPLPVHGLHEDPGSRRARRAPDGRSTGDWRATMNKDAFAVIGQPLPKIDAWGKVTGETRYADDLVLPRMAYAKLLRSPHPHALIKRIDTSRARAVPGVYAVITGHDLPRVKFGILPVSQDEEALCTEKVRMVGDAVAAVAAVDEETAERAAELIEVDYEPLRPLMSIEEALAHPEVRIHEYGDGPNVHKAVSLQFGDVEAAFVRAHLVREDAFFFEGNTHLPMEQHAAVAHWGADGQLTRWSSTSTPHYVHRTLAQILV